MLKALAIIFALASAMTLQTAGAVAATRELKTDAPISAFASNDRAYAVTNKSDYAVENFQADVTVTIRSGNGGNGCAFFGMGQGIANPENYNEPTTSPSLVFRLTPSDFVGGQAAAFVNGTPRDTPEHLGDGTHRLRFSWDASKQRAWLEIHPNWKAGTRFSSQTCLFLSAVLVDFGTEAHLFVGGACGVEFSDLSIKRLSTEDLKKLPSGGPFSDDPSAGTWLPVKGTSDLAHGDSITKPVDEFLGDLKGRLRPLICWYQGASLQASRALPGGELHLPDSSWHVAVDTKLVDGDADGRDVTLKFDLKDGNASAAGIAAAFDFSAWSTNNYVLIPASVYNGNRNRIEKRAYASGLSRNDLYKKDLQLTTCDLPQLSPDAGAASKVEVSTCNATTPAMCFYDGTRKRAFIVLGAQGTQLGDNGLNIEENADRSVATFVISAPSVRERKPEFVGFSKSSDRGANWKSGDEVQLHLRIYSFATPDIPGLLEKFMTVRKAVTGQNHPRNLVPFSEITRLLDARIDSRFYNGADSQFYCPENAQWISFGWIGGLMDTYPMLAKGDQGDLDRVTKTFDFAFAHGQGNAGYFYGALNHDGKPFAREGYNEHPEICLTRKNADVLYWMVMQFMLLKSQGRADAIKSQWEQATKRLADAFVSTWKSEHQWGNFVNIDTGQVAIYNTSGGVMAIGGLALASDYFHNPEYLSIASQAADFYYHRDFVELGMTTGACADILQNADSETAAGFMMSLMALYEVTSDPTWLEKSRSLANLVATWTVSYDYQLPPDTELSRLGAKLCGAVWASTQNKHGAPGFCTSAGEALFKIYRATGDLRYAQLMHDVVHAHAEGLHADGAITERLTYCDADSRGTRGSGSTGWNELNGILMALELPGLYVQTDADRFFVFDHIEAKIIRRDGSGVSIEVHNTTKFDAHVAIFAETAAQAAKPQGYTAFLHWPKVDLKAGETKRVNISCNGAIQS